MLAKIKAKIFKNITVNGKSVTVEINSILMIL